MADSLVESILKRGVASSKAFPSVSANTTPVIRRDDVSLPQFSSRVPTSVKKKKKSTVFSFPDGTEFELDTAGKPVKASRSISTEQKQALRGGSFEDTQEEIDHRVSVALGGTDTPSNLQSLKSKKTPLQFLQDFFSNKERSPGEFNPEKRQEGKLPVELRAIEKYEAGEITLSAAQEAVKNYDNKELVNDLLKEEFYSPKGAKLKKTLTGIQKFIEPSFIRNVKPGSKFTDQPGFNFVSPGSSLPEKIIMKALQEGVVKPLMRAGAGVALSLGKGEKKIQASPLTKGLFGSGYVGEEPGEVVSIQEQVKRAKAGEGELGSVSGFLQKKIGASPAASVLPLIGLVTISDLFPANPLKATKALKLPGVLNKLARFGKETSDVALKLSNGEDVANVSEQVLKNISNEIKAADPELVSKVGTTNDLVAEAKKYKSADEFVQAMQRDPKKIPTTTEFQNFLTEREAFIKREKEIYAEMKSMREVYSEKTIADVPSSDIAKYENLRKELDQTLNKKTLARVPEGVVLTHIGEKGLATQLTDIWNKANRPTGFSKIGVTGPSRSGGSYSFQPKSGTDLPSVPPQSSLVPPRTVNTLQGKINFIDDFRTPDRVLKKIGLQAESKALRRGLEVAEAELPKNLDKITAWANSLPKASNNKIFKALDGQDIKLNAAEEKVAGEIKSWLKEWADRLALPPSNRISNYITHVFDESLIAKEFDEDLAKIISEKIPSQIYDPFVLKRIGKKSYIEDTWKALDAYVKRATRKVHLDPVLAVIKNKVGTSLDMTSLEKSQFEYLQKQLAHINFRPSSLDNKLDNTFKEFFGYALGQRPTTKILRLFRQMTYRGFLGLNPASALKNLSQGVNTYAVLGEKYTPLGYLKLFQKGAKEELEQTGVLKNSFIQDRTLSATKKAIEKMDKGLFIFFDTAEKINRGAAYFGAKSKALNEGKTLEEAVEFAKEIVRKTQFSYSRLDTPMILQSEVAKTLGQFQTFSLKQTEFLVEMAKDKNFLGLLRYALGGTAFVFSVGQAFGMEPKDLIPTFRLGTPPSLKFPLEVVKAAVDAPDAFGNQRDKETKLKDIGKSAVGLIPAGLQAKKTLEGLENIKESDSLPKKAQSVLFGKYAGEKSDKKLVKELTTTAERIAALPQEQAIEAFEAEVAKNPEIKSKLTKEIKDIKSGITEEEKEIRALGVADGARSDAVAKKLKALQSQEERITLWEDYVAKGILTTSVQDQVKALLASEKE